MSAVVRLPTAAPRYVAQPRPRVRRDAVSAAIEAGSVISFPGEYISGWERADKARQASNTAIYEAGGLSRGPTLLLASAILTTLSAEQHAGVRAFLGILPSDDPAAVAALHWAEQIAAAAASLRACADGEGVR